jgi:hypothetical protein
MAGFKHRTHEIVDLCGSTTMPSGPLPLAETARGGEGVLAGRADVESVAHSGRPPLSALIGANRISRTTGHGWPESTAQSADEATIRRTSS